MAFWYDKSFKAISELNLLYRKVLIIPCGQCYSKSEDYNFVKYVLFTSTRHSEKLEVQNCQTNALWQNFSSYISLSFPYKSYSKSICKM